MTVLYHLNAMDVAPKEEDIFGWIGGITALIYNLPQIYHIFKTKKTQDLSLISWLMRCFAYIMYLIHVYIKKDAALFYTNLLAFVQVVIVTTQIFVYKSSCREKKHGQLSSQSTKFRAPDAETSSSDDERV